MSENDQEPSDVSENDILFECIHCGKSLAIDSQGAGLMIRCPDCDNEVQVPVLEDVEQEDLPGREQAVSDAEEVPLAAAQEEIEDENQVRTLITELEELRFRRRFLEKERSDHAKTVQALVRQIEVMRADLDQMDEIIKEFTGKGPDDTQQLGR